MHEWTTWTSEFATIDWTNLNEPHDFDTIRKSFGFFRECGIEMSENRQSQLKVEIAHAQEYINEHHSDWNVPPDSAEGKTKTVPPTSLGQLFLNKYRIYLSLNFSLQ